MAVEEVTVPVAEGPASELVKAALGLPAWQVRQGFGSFVTMEFGAAEPGCEAEPQRGEIRLWIYQCAWVLQSATDVLASSEDDRDQIASGLARLEGECLLSIDVEPPASDTRFAFGNGLHLSTFAVNSGPQITPWMLILPGERVLSVGPGVGLNLDDSAPQGGTS